MLRQPQAPAAFLCLPMPQPCSAGLSFTLPSNAFPHRQGWDLFLTGKAKQTQFCFKLDSILWGVMEVKVHVGSLFPSHTLGLQMNQFNTLLKARQCRQSPGMDISCLLTTQPRAQPAAGSSRLGFTGLLLNACSYSNPDTALPVPPPCRACPHRCSLGREGMSWC